MIFKKDVGFWDYLGNYKEKYEYIPWEEIEFNFLEKILIKLCNKFKKSYTIKLNKIVK